MTNSVFLEGAKVREWGWSLACIQVSQNLELKLSMVLLTGVRSARMEKRTERCIARQVPRELQHLLVLHEEGCLGVRTV